MTNLNLSPEQKEELAIAIEELERRGINIPQAIHRKRIRWPVDRNGYFVKKDGSYYEPSENQGGFVESPAYFSAFIGPRGSGKTGAGAQKALIKTARGGDGAVLNPDFTNFKDSTWPEFREWIPWEMVVHTQRYRQEHSWKPQQPFTLSFMNGRNIICKGLKDPDSARGPNINWLWYDEAQRDKTGESWKIAIASVRVGKDPQAFVTATPAGKQHWMYEFFVKQNLSPAILEALEELGYEGDLIEWYHGTREDNREHLDKMYVVSLMAGYADDSYLYRQEVEGLFVTPEGAIGDRRWFDDKILKEMPDINIEDDVRYWDLAATEKKIKTNRRGKKDPDETAGTRMVWDGEEDFYIKHQISGRWVYDDILDVMYRTAVQDGPFVKIFVEQEPGAGGKNQVAAIQKFFREGDADHRPLPQFKIEGHKPEGDKVMRANYWFAEASRGHVYLIEGEWNEPFLDQVDVFADGDYDDLVDSTSGARLCVAPIFLWASVPFMKL
jgi:predicted phage terminase large subunit-like protein